MVPSKRKINKHVIVLLWAHSHFCHFVFSILHCNSAIASHPPLYILMADLSILELYILVCMNRLEDKEQNSYNFNTIMKGITCSSPFIINPRQKTDGWWTGCLSEYKSIQEAYKTSDKYATTVCFRVSMRIIRDYWYMYWYIMSKEFTCFIDSGFWTSLGSRVDYLCRRQREKCGAWISPRQTSDIFSRACTSPQDKHYLPCESLSAWFDRNSSPLFSLALFISQYEEINGLLHWWMMVFLPFFFVSQAVLQKLLDRERYM